MITFPPASPRKRRTEQKDTFFIGESTVVYVVSLPIQDPGIVGRGKTKTFELILFHSSRVEQYTSEIVTEKSYLRLRYLTHVEKNE